jgi:hypothetical protein
LYGALVKVDSIKYRGEEPTFDLSIAGDYPNYLANGVVVHNSRNSASSRAIPVSKVMKQVYCDPAVPVAWGANQKGMQARVELSGVKRWIARRLFLWARIPALVFAWLLTKAGLHKQITNRILEPWVWHTAVVSGTEWDNFYAQRCHPDAQPEFRELAEAIRRARSRSHPRALEWGEWHLPYVDVESATRGGAVRRIGADTWANVGPGGMCIQTGDTAKCCEMGTRACSTEHKALPKISAACCARVSYVRQNDRKSKDEDLAFADRLARDRHFSPLEHPAKATRGQWGNFAGFRQLRKFYDGEDGRTRED